MSDMQPPQPPQNPVPPTPPGPPPFGSVPPAGMTQPPLGAPSQAPGGAPSWQSNPGGSWTPGPPAKSGSGVKIAVILALLAVVGLAIGAVFAFSGGDDGGSTTPATTATDDDDTDEPTAETAAPAETAVPAETAAPAETTAPTETEAPTETAAPTVTEAPTTPPTLSLPPEVNLFEGQQARNVIDEVAAARGADPLRILQVTIYPTYAFAQVQDPSIPENVDEYQWRDNRLSDPAPVRLVGGGDLETNLFSSTEVTWKAIPTLVAGALDATGLADGEVTHVIVTRNLPFTPDVVIRVYVNSPRKSGFIEADAAGNVLEINVS